MNQLREVLQQRVSSDPVTLALSEVVAAAVTEALAQARLPKLAFTRSEVADLLGIDRKIVSAMVADGRLRTLGPEPQAKITIGSLLNLVGWPIAPAPVAAPLAVAPVAGGEL